MAVANKKTMVRAMSKIVRAISLGVFRRCAFHHRDHPVKKGFARLTLQAITSQSERIRVPPVTEAKSPPDSRITGADSPVIALSSTEAPPSMTSPSQGIISPALTRQCRLSAVQRRARYRPAHHGEGRAGGERTRSFFTPFRLFARALLRPSASASAKLANSTVNHNHRLIIPVNKALPAICPVTIASVNRVVSTLPGPDHKHHRVTPLGAWA